MKNILLFVVLAIAGCWAVPKPMESIENYNVLMVHGAYGSDKNYILTIRDSIEDYLTEENPAYAAQLQQLNFAVAQEMSQIDFDNMVFPEANEADHFIGEANLGDYDKDSRITYWLSEKVLEENPSTIKHPKDSYVYNWRSFSNPANSSYNNAFELGKRTWNKGNKRYGEGGFGHRRALMEEAQEVKARFVIDENDPNSDLYGQVALDSMRHNPDLYHQLASRYILIGHSMGGVVAREYTQNSDYYHGDVDKIITLDSPHEGTGALEMQLDMVGHKWEALQGTVSYLAGLSLLYLNMRGDFMAKAVAISSASWATLLGITNFVAPFFVEWNLQDYSEDDPLVKYVNPGNGETGNISYLKGIPANDSLPMFRLMGG